MFRQFLKGCCRVAVRVVGGAIKLGGRFLRAIGDATSISSFPLQIVNGDSSLARACVSMVPSIVSGPVVVQAGAAVKSLAAKVAVGAAKLGWPKLVAISVKIALASSALVGTAVVASGVLVGFAAAVWLSKMMIQGLGEIIDTAAGVRDTGDVGKELMSVIAA
jgi:hypothetical protein